MDRAARMRKKFVRSEHVTFEAASLSSSWEHIIRESFRQIAWPISLSVDDESVAGSDGDGQQQPRPRNLR
jgi:hypothetical protein